MPIATPELSSGVNLSRKRRRRKYWVFLVSAFFELFYLSLIVLSPLPELNLSKTPLEYALPWTMFPSHLLQSWSGSLLAALPWLASFLLGVAFVGMLATYAITVFLLWSRKKTIEQEKSWLALLIGGVVLFGGTLLFLPALFSDNVFTFMFTGRILTVYGENPLNTMPALFSNDPYLSWVISGLNSPNIYGPLWISVCIVLSLLSNSPVISLFLFKGMALGIHLLNLLLIWGILGRVAPARRVIGTLLYAWCPLALIEIVGNGHGESMQITLLLLATWLYVRSLPSLPTRQTEGERVQLRQPEPATARWLRGGALLALGLALSTNLVVLLIAPFVLWYHQRYERRVAHACFNVSWQMGLLVIPELLLMLPFWRGMPTFLAITSSVDMEHFVYAPVGLFALPLREIFVHVAGLGLNTLPGILPSDLAADLTIRASAACVFVLIYAHLFGRVRRAPRTIAAMYQEPGADTQTLTPGFDSLIDCCAIAIFWYLILVSGWFWPWYILWFFWLIVLRRIDTFTFAILVLSGTALLIYAFVGFSRAPLATYQTAFIFGIPLLYLLVVSRWKGSAERISASDVQRK